MHRTTLLPAVAVALLTQLPAPGAPVTPPTDPARPAQPTDDGAARPEASIETLIARPDLRPARVAATRDFRFGDGTVIAEGTELAVHDLTRTAIVLDAGAFIFNADHADTDLLERAKALIDGLSTAALALTYESLRERDELWPTHVTMTAPIAFQNGLRIEAGTTLALRTLADGQASIFSPRGNLTFTADPSSTDILARARRAATEAERTGTTPRPHFVRSIEAAIGAPEPVLDAAEYVVVFRGRRACSRCARFTPELKRAYARLRRDHENFQVVFLSDDRTEADFDQYVAEAEMPWPVVPYGKVDEAAHARTIPGGRMLPVVLLVAPDGTVIDSTQRSSASDVLSTLRSKLRG